MKTTKYLSVLFLQSTEVNIKFIFSVDERKKTGNNECEKLATILKIRSCD